MAFARAPVAFGGVFIDIRARLRYAAASLNDSEKGGMMELLIFFAVLFTTAYALARATRGDRDALYVWLAIFVLTALLGTVAIDVWGKIIHQYKLIAGPLIAKHGESIATTVDVPWEIFAWILGTPITALVLALVSP